jgi:hypothetical protein
LFFQVLRGLIQSAECGTCPCLPLGSLEQGGDGSRLFLHYSTMSDKMRIALRKMSMSKLSGNVCVWFL